MIAIRGATTISADTPEDIRGAVKELFMAKAPTGSKLKT